MTGNRDGCASFLLSLGAPRGSADFADPAAEVLGSAGRLTAAHHINAGYKTALENTKRSTIQFCDKELRKKPQFSHQRSWLALEPRNRR